jgi:nucleoid DNA-binding protein
MGSLCPISNNFFQDENHITIKSSNKTRVNFNQSQYYLSGINRNGKRKYLTDFTPLEFCDEISQIFKIRIPFFDNAPLQVISKISYITGNGPYHEGLIFLSKTYNFYIAQSYPITFVKVKNFTQGISDIISFNNFNNTSHSYKIPEIFYPTLPITILDIYEIINKLPNQYHILTENCQNFVNNIIEALKEKYNIIAENDPIKIEESFNNFKVVNLKLKKRNNKTQDCNEIKNYVDENKIYFRNIFEEKRNRLKSSRSDGNIFGKLSKNYNRIMNIKQSKNIINQSLLKY